MPITLRGYQGADVGLLRDSFKQSNKVLYVLPTGGGKTRVFSYIAEAAVQKAKRVLILVHRKNLVIQTSRNFADMGIKHSMIAAEDTESACVYEHLTRYKRVFIAPKKNIVIAGIQALVRREESLHFDLIIADEAHHVVAGSWSKTMHKILAVNPNAKFLGVTATPLRLDGNGLGLFFEKMVANTSIEYLVRQGYLCSPKTYWPDFSYKIPQRGGDYDADAMADIFTKGTIYGDTISEYRNKCHNVPALAFCPNVKAAQELAKMFCDAGYRAVSVDGTMPSSQVTQALDGLATGRYHLVANCDLVSEGTDVPLVGCVIQLRKTKSLALHLQQVGRALRPYPMDNPIMDLPHMKNLIQNGQHIAHIIDQVANVREHGDALEPREWDLQYGTAERKKAMEKTHSSKSCENCFRDYPSRKRSCPFCGHVNAVKKKRKISIDESVPLVEYSKDAAILPAIKQASAVWQNRKVIAKARTLEELEEVRRKLGYKKGWEYMVYKSRKKKK